MLLNPPGRAAIVIPPISNTVSTPNKIASNMRVRLEVPPTPLPPGPPGAFPLGGRPPPPLAALPAFVAPAPMAVAPPTTAAIFPELPRLIGRAVFVPFGCDDNSDATIGTATASAGGTGNLRVILGRGAVEEKVIIPGPGSAWFCDPFESASVGSLS